MLLPAASFNGTCTLAQVSASACGGTVAVPCGTPLTKTLSVPGVPAALPVRRITS